MSDGNEAEGIFSNTISMTDSGINEVGNIYGIYGVNDAIVIKGYTDRNVKIYAIDGKLLRDIVVGSDSVCVPSDEGVFLITVDGKSAKVIVR